VKASPKPIVLFIDEAHTIIGAGGPQGGGDAANLLKPALARGELRTIAATTWAEYKKYFEKDAALERRFQPVKVEEPSIEGAPDDPRPRAPLRRGARRRHPGRGGARGGVAVEPLHQRRQLPDKAVDLLDTAAARAKIVRAARPPVIDDTKAALAGVERELQAYERDYAAGISVSDERKTAALTRQTRSRRSSRCSTSARPSSARSSTQASTPSARSWPAARRPSARARAELDKLKAIKPEELLVHADVDEALVASIICDWTGIPVGKMVKDDVEAILHLEDGMRRRVRGQDGGSRPSRASSARRARASSRRNSRSACSCSSAPAASARRRPRSASGRAALRRRALHRHHQHERVPGAHTVAKLIGSPPGYVGFGEGGVLTEAVRQRPYSVVLLDECEKADKEVLNIFYQVFDKGMLADGEGRVIDFKNTVIILTSNLATDLITSAAMPGSPAPPSRTSSRS
jgi:type VI secretion system protein VasG